MLVTTNSRPEMSNEAKVFELLHLMDSGVSLVKVHQAAEGLGNDEVSLDAFRRGMEALQRINHLWPQQAPQIDLCSREKAVSFGRFQLRQELGSGGFGVVYLAYDPQLGREVALKLPRTSLLGESMRQRFRQEAIAAARLDHPGLVQVYDSGQFEGVDFIASAYCPGITLAVWLQANGRSNAGRDAAHLAFAIAQAIAHAHARGVLHRDLKPSNVLLFDPDPPASNQRERRSLAALQPKITDFGLAKFLLEEETFHTKSGTVLGTASYMAPEQAAGRLRDVSTATDVYAIGVILYEVLTGQLPFTGDSTTELLDRIRTIDPRPPSVLRSDVPLDLDTICLKCLQKDPAHRYASARELADDLERFLQGRPVMARRASTVERVWKWCRRRPVVATLLTLLVLSVLIGSTASAILFGRAVRSRDRLVASLGKLVESVESSPNIPGEEQKRYYHAIGDRLRDLLDEERAFGSALEKRTYLLLWLAVLDDRIGKTSVAIQSVEQALSDLRAHPEMYRDPREHKLALSWAYYLRASFSSNSEEKTHFALKGIELLRDVKDGAGLLRLAQLHNLLAIALGKNLTSAKVRQEQLSAFLKARQLGERVFREYCGNDSPERLPLEKELLTYRLLNSVLSNLTVVYLDAPRALLPEALETSEECFRLTKVFLDRHPENSIGLDFVGAAGKSLAWTYARLKRQKEALSVYESAFTTIESGLRDQVTVSEVKMRAFLQLAELSFDAGFTASALYEESKHCDTVAARDALKWFSRARDVNMALRLIRPNDPEPKRQYALCWGNIAEIKEKLREISDLPTLLHETCTSYELFMAALRDKHNGMKESITDHDSQNLLWEELLCAQLWTWYSRVLVERRQYALAKDAREHALHHVALGTPARDKNWQPDLLQALTYRLALQLTIHGRLREAAAAWRQWTTLRFGSWV
jgi:tetratricopeptide (TPR) repeat protein